MLKHIKNSKMKGKGYQQRRLTAGPSQVGGNFILTGNDSPLDLTLNILGKKIPLFLYVNRGLVRNKEEERQPACCWRVGKKISRSDRYHGKNTSLGLRLER